MANAEEETTTEEAAEAGEVEDMAALLPLLLLDSVLNEKLSGGREPSCCGGIRFVGDSALLMTPTKVSKHTGYWTSLMSDKS